MLKPSFFGTKSVSWKRNYLNKAIHSGNLAISHLWKFFFGAIQKGKCMPMLPKQLKPPIQTVH